MKDILFNPVSTEEFGIQPTPQYGVSLLLNKNSGNLYLKILDFTISKLRRTLKTDFFLYLIVYNYNALYKARIFKYIWLIWYRFW